MSLVAKRKTRTAKVAIKLPETDKPTVKQSVADAIEFIRKCPYKGTAIKVELEAQLDRPEGDDSSWCEPCGGDGYTYCDSCEDGSVVEAGHTVDCENCNGEATIECNHCNGEGEIYSNGGNWDEDNCEEFLLDHVSPEARDALIFHRFYNDGSVDSEFTFTVPIYCPHVVLEFIEAFKLLADEIGNGMDTDGAGMHIAILNSKSGNYPRGNSLDSTCADNFRKSMTHLLPALFFLGSCDHKSRHLQYRMPKIDMGDKYSAVSGSHNVFEYRVFETCYDRPQAFLDMFCTIAKSLQFYTKKYVPLDFFNKIGEIGMRDGYGIERFYFTLKHLEALDQGLKVLKPDYKTISQLKRERNFKVCKSKLTKDEAKNNAKWRQEFTEFKERANHEEKRQKKYHSDCYNREHAMYASLSADHLRSFLQDWGTKEEWVARQMNEWRQQHPNTLRGYLGKKQQDFMLQDVRTRIMI